MKIEWSQAARRDLAQIEAYLEERNPQAAERVARTIALAAYSLKDMPYRGAAGRLAGTRELLSPRYPYRIVYAVATGCVLIVRVLHTAQTRCPPEWQ